MRYRKFQATNLFTGTTMLGADAVLVTDENGIVQEIVAVNDAGDAIQPLQGLLTPGFINTHCHLELSHMKEKIPEGTGLIAFLTRVIKERSFAPHQIYNAMLQAEEELYKSGTVAVGDICNTTDSIPIKKKSRICWHNFVEVIGFTEEKAEERLGYAQKLLEQFETEWRVNDAPQRENLSEASSITKRSSAICNRTTLTPHAPYSVSSRLFKMINEASSEKIISIHNQESQHENELYRHNTGDMFSLYRDLNINPSFFKGSGKSSLQTFLPWLNKAADIILVHNTFTSEEDLAFIKKSKLPNLFFCICINANRYIESCSPPLELLIQSGGIITLGTDSYASNRQLNMLEEIKTVQNEFGRTIKLSSILRWATMNGARALRMEEKLGSFEKGKQPGVVLIDNVEDQIILKNAKATRIV